MTPLREIKFIQYLLFSMLLFFSALTLKAQNIYYEAFNLPDGTTTDAGNSAWSRNISGLTLNAGDEFDVQNEYFYANDIDGEGIWTSQVMNISGISGGVDISIDVIEVGSQEGTDYIRLYYKVNGGGETIFANLTDDFSSGFFPAFQTESVSGITGNTLQIVVRVRNNEDNEQHAFDNVTVKYTNGGASLNSIASGDWDLGTTWSTAGYAGASCGCFPNEETDVYIGNNRTVDLTTNGYVNAITIDNTGILQDDGSTDAPLIFQKNSGTSLLINNGVVNVWGLHQMGSNTLEISGSGNITTDQFILYTSGSIVTNDLNGTLTVNDDLYFDNSNQTFTNNGTLTVNDDLYFDNNNQTFTNNDAVTIGGDISAGALWGFIPYSGNVVNNNASATVSMTGDISLSNTDVTFNNYGVLNQSGNFTNIDNGSSFKNMDGGTWNWTYAGTNYDANVNNILDCTDGTNTFNYGASGTQNIIPVTYSNLSLSGSGTKSTQDNLDINSNLSLAGTSVLDVVTNADTVYLAGNWINSGGTFAEGSAGEAVILDGNGDQSISNASGETFNHLTIDKPSGTVSLSNGDVVVNGNLTLTAGNIALGDQQLTLSSSGSIIGGSTSSFIVTDGNGQLTQNALGAGARTGDIAFPVGANTSSYTPLIINNTTGTADNFGVKICAGIYNNGSCGVSSAATEDAVNRSWFISEAVAGGSDVTLTFQWNAGNELTNFYREDLTIIHHNGSEWEDIASGSAAGSGPYTASAANVTSFSPFGIKTTASFPLPIELVSFSAKLLEDEVQLEWVTASELNNDFFTIEKTVDFKNFEEVAIVKGKGTFNGTSTYTLRDDKPYTGISYYRLKQTDFDGAFSYSSFVAVNKQVQVSDINLYPVPNNGEYINLRVASTSDEAELSITIFDITGMVVYASGVSVDSNQEYQINFKEKLAPGIYTLQVGSMSVRKKFIVHERAVW